jgi:class 3 adenylate cyclase
VEYYNFFCIDIVGSSVDVDSQLENIKELLRVIKDFLENFEKKLQISFTGDGVIIWFKEDSLLPLQLALKIHENFPPCSEEQNFGLKIGIARNKAIEIESAKSILGIPVWGNGPTFAKRLCDLCDDSHILLDSNAYEFFTKNYKKETGESFGFKIDNNRFFQDLGEFFVKHKKPVHVFNFCNTKQDGKLFIFGNIAIPKDKRGLIDRVDINSKLVIPFDIFLESEALSLKKKIDQGKEIVLLNESTANLYHALFEDASQYDSTNLLLPSKFQEYQSKTSYLNLHANLIRRTKIKDFQSVRIMILDKTLIEKDWQNSKTRNLCADFFKWHKEWGVTLLEIDPSTALELVRKLEDSIPTFYIKSTEMGLWKEKYVLQSENFGLDEYGKSIKTNRIWLSDSNTTYYKNCELFFQELLSSDELWEILYEDREGIDFVKWNHTYWKPQLLRYS